MVQDVLHDRSERVLPKGTIMKKKDFFFDLAAEEKKRRKQEVCILADEEECKVRAIGVHSGNAGDTPDTAIVNALSNANMDSDIRDCLCVSTYEPTEMCKGMKKYIIDLDIMWEKDKGPTKQKWVAEIDDKAQTQARDQLKALAGKAFSSRSTPADLAKRFTDVPVGNGPAYQKVGWIDQVYMNLVMAMLGTTWNPNKGHDASEKSGDKYGGNNVACVLTHKDSVVAWGLNVMAQNKTFHAETIMLQAYLTKKNLKKLPADTVLYTSLQSCHMCGGFIYQVRDDSTKVIYGMADGDLTTVLTDQNIEEECDITVSVPAIKSYDLGKGEKYSIIDTRLGSKKGQIGDLRPGLPGASTTVLVDDQLKNRGKHQEPLGNAFQQFPQWLLQQRESMADLADTNDNKKAVTHALGVLKNVAVSGMMTTYGIDLIEVFFADTQKAVKK